MIDKINPILPDDEINQILLGKNNFLINWIFGYLLINKNKIIKGYLLLCS